MIVLTLYIVLNGACYQDRAGFYLGRDRLVVNSHYVTIDAKAVPPPVRDLEYLYYKSGDTLLAVHPVRYPFRLQSSRFKLTNRVIPIDTIILTLQPCATD